MRIKATNTERNSELTKLLETLTEELRQGFASWITDDRTGAEERFRSIAETLDVLSGTLIVPSATDETDWN